MLVIFHFRFAVCFPFLAVQKPMGWKRKCDVGRHVENLSAAPFLPAWHVAEWRTV